MKNLYNNVELLAPVGDYNCLKAAVQNGADSVYFGANTFSARASATNFNFDELKQAIQYAKIRNVKTNLTLNTLIKDSEFDEAVELASFAYKNGIDAIIVQDLGLANYLIKNFSDLPIHASTQMTIHNLEGALQAEKMGFKRVVLSREVPFEEIKNICENTSIEIETFIHGALCISYSGQCLLSSMIGGRSGNRGRCAQPCRLPYKLIEQSNSNKEEQILDTGYLLSTKDLCGLEYIPLLIEAGVKCFKIEGRMKPPEYVATVTRIYRKYIDLAQSGKTYKIDENDLKDLQQVFNRGNFSVGHLSKNANTNLIYPEKPNNMGLYLGTVYNFNSAKGYITLKLLEPLNIGDTISLEKETGTYTISELMINGKNVPTAQAGTIVKIGRMKGKIKVNDKIFKLSDKFLSQSAKKTFDGNEIKKINLNCKISIKENLPIRMSVSSSDNSNFYNNLSVSSTSETIAVPAINAPITKDRIISQINKTGNTPYQFANIDIELDENLYIPSISCLNELRRCCLEKLQNIIIEKYCNKQLPNFKSENFNNNFTNTSHISILLNILNTNFKYENLTGINNVYIPLNYFIDTNFENTINKIIDKFDVYIYLPTILKNNNINFDNILSKFKIKGFVLSNISHFNLLKKYNTYNFIANYTLNCFNTKTISELSNLGATNITLSPELDKTTILELINNNFCNTELILYGKLPVMNINYCLLSKSNKCYNNCSNRCSTTTKTLYLKDRIGSNFQILTDTNNSITTIYNSKITSINLETSNCNKRIDFINESLTEMQNIINTIISGNRIEGKDYTNGNFNKVI